MNRKLLYILFGFASLFILYRLYFTEGKKAEGTISVSVHPVVQQDVNIEFKTLGTVEAYSSVDIKSMVTGPLLRTGFQEGDTVKPNQVLFEIDPRPFMITLSETHATLARDKATLIDDELKLKRNEQLVKKGFIAKQDYDTLSANVQSAKAAVKADEAAVFNATLQLQYTTIRAPLSGKTGNILLKPGSIVKANDTNALVTINQINPIYIVFSVSQDKLLPIQENLKQGDVFVQAIINGYDVQNGKLAFIDNNISTTTGTIQLKAIFPNPSQLLWPGEYVSVTVPIKRLLHALLIPSLALSTSQNGFYVYVIDQTLTAHQHKVKPGPTIGDETLIEAGLKPGDNVVVAGQLKLLEGTKVNVSHLQEP